MSKIKKYQTGGPVKTTKKPKTVSQRLGDITLRDVKNAGEDALNLSTLGGYAKVKRALGGKYRGKKDGGKISKAKDGKSFPDLNKDGKITRADILKGRGVIAKKGASVKKYQMGGFVSNEFAAKSMSKPKPTSNMKLLDSSIKKGKAINAYQGKKGRVAKSGVSMKTCKGGC
jgi:hypothetical protein